MSGKIKVILVTVNTSIEDRPRIDDFLPHHDFSAAYEIRVRAPASVVYERLLNIDFNKLWLVRTLMTIRSGKRFPRQAVPGSLHQRLQGTGFVILTEVPNQELVLGVAGRFWRPDGGRCMDLMAGEFVGFARPGFAKAAWNFRLHADSPGDTVLSTETRVKCFGATARCAFRLYWSLVGPFSGLMRKAILKQIKLEAELAACESSPLEKR
jgi:hypothetical protein